MVVVLLSRWGLLAKEQAVQVGWRWRVLLGRVAGRVVATTSRSWCPTPLCGNDHVVLASWRWMQRHGCSWCAGSTTGIYGGRSVPSVVAPVG
jgi:hypothetical protein